jgi:multicomponent Na+:H+ antiporter subunit A
VAKEAALEGLWHDGEPLGIAAFVVVVVGSVLTFAYGLRFWWGAFATKPASAGVEPTQAGRPSLFLVGPAGVLALGGVVVGLLPGQLERVVAPHAATYPHGEEGHLVLWAGFGAPAAGTLVVLLGGAGLFLARRWVERVQERAPSVPDADLAYRRSMRRLDAVAATVTGATQRGSLPAYLAVTLVVTVTFAVWTTLAGGIGNPGIRLWDSSIQLVVAVIVAGTAFLAVRARRRLKAVLLAGASGYGIAVLFAVQGAPDLALTQVLVETVTLVVFVLVLRRLPAYFSNRPLAGSRWFRAALGLVVGVVVAGLAILAPSARIHAPVSVEFPEQAYLYGHGKNIVNVTLVDIRAWDTMGEIAVILVAATGVASLVFLRTRMRAIARVRDLTPETAAAVWAGGPDPTAVLRSPSRGRGGGAQPGPGRNREWLTGGASLAPHRRSVIFEVATRLIFHTMLVFAVFLLFAGHNAPGGGFAAGLVAGIALTVRYLAGGRYELGEAVPVHPGLLLGTGLFLSVGVGLVPLAFGGEMLQSALVELDAGPLGEIKLVTALFFDIGVFLVVIGLVLDVLRTLGAEVDRQGEVEGRAVPDVAYDSPLVTVDDAEPTLELPAQPGVGPGHGQVRR